ncbi:MAG TPA: MFS transporter [Nitrososphaerales archaeon]|nr:MFS transporter [Nitrososphaerales archaeon]
MAAVERPSYRTVLAKRNFDLLLGGRGFSDLGDYFGNLALSWLVYGITGSVFSLAFTWVVFMLPRAAVRLYAGVYVDRWNRRSIMLGTETCRMILFAVIGATALLGSATSVLIYVVAASVGALGAFFDLASDALLPAVVEKGELLTANALFESVFQGNSIVGPALAGLAIYAFGIAVPFLIDSLSFAVLVVALFFVVLPQAPPTAEGPPWSSLFMEGFRYFRGRMELVMISVLTSGLNFGLGAFWYVYVLVFARDVLKAGPVGYALFGAVSSAGFLCGTLTLARRGRLSRRRTAVIVSMLVAAAGVTMVSFASNLIWALAPTAVFGLALPFFDIVGTTYYQETVPKDMLGRALGFRRFIDFITAPVSVVFGAFMVSWVGVANGILASGLIMFGCAFAAVSARSLRRLDQAAPFQTVAG